MRQKTNQRGASLAAVLFLAGLALGFALVASSFFGGEGYLEGLIKGLRQGPDEAGALLEGAENAVSRDLDRSHLLIELYGGFQRLCGRQYLQDPQGSDVVKLSNGTLNFINTSSQSADPNRQADQTVRLRDALAQEQIPYLFVLAPQKIERGKQLLPAGVEEHGNENASRFLDALSEAGVERLDLRPAFEATGDYAGWFFRTDHHWKPEAAFYAWQILAATWEARYGWVTDPTLLDEANYQKTVLSNFFLGSQGKRTGSLYAGTDDITCYCPTFPTKFTYAIRDSGTVREGSFEDALLFPERIAKKDWFGGNPYTLYAGGDYGFARIRNHSYPDGPKVLLIRDSFACALTPFLALSCGELITVDLRYLPQGELLSVIRQEQPDLVMTLYTVGTVALEQMFAF